MKKSLKIRIVVLVVVVAAACYLPGEIHQALENGGYYRHTVIGTWRGPSGDLIVSPDGTASYQGMTARWSTAVYNNMGVWNRGPSMIVIAFPSGSMSFSVNADGAGDLGSTVFQAASPNVTGTVGQLTAQAKAQPVTRTVPSALAGSPASGSLPGTVQNAEKQPAPSKQVSLNAAWSQLIAAVKLRGESAGKLSVFGEPYGALPAGWDEPLIQYNWLIPNNEPRYMTVGVDNKTKKIVRVSGELRDVSCSTSSVLDIASVMGLADRSAVVWSGPDNFVEFVFDRGGGYEIEVEGSYSGVILSHRTDLNIGKVAYYFAPEFSPARVTAVGIAYGATDDLSVYLATYNRVGTLPLNRPPGTITPALPI